MLIDLLFQSWFDLLVTLAVAYCLGSVYQESSTCIGYEALWAGLHGARIMFWLLFCASCREGHGYGHT